MMEIEQLWNEIDRATSPLGWENIPLDQAGGRVLAREACASADQPPFDQSAVDGYALATPGPGQFPPNRLHFQLAGRQVAGQGAGLPLKVGEAGRILTGAVVPEGAVCVIKQEDCTFPGAGRVETPADLPIGSNIRRQGGILKTGEPVLPTGTRITPGAIGLLAASGIGLVGVIRHPRVLHLITGDELVSVGDFLKPGQIHDANGPMIAALLKERGIPAKHLEQLRLGDDSREIGAAAATFQGDLLLISGGSGPGDRDHTLNCLEREGFKIHASRLNSRPGKPLIFATRDHQIAFGLPGNPLSHFVCYHAFVRRVLDHWEGVTPFSMTWAALAESLQAMGDGRRTWHPGVIENNSGENRVWPLKWKHSGDLTPLASANALILLDAADLSAGNPVAVLRLP